MATAILTYCFQNKDFEYECKYTRKDFIKFLDGESAFDYIKKEDVEDYELVTEDDAIDYLVDNLLADEIADFAEYLAEEHEDAAFRQYLELQEPNQGAAEIPWGGSNPLYD